MMEYLAELGVGGIFAILVLQTVLPYLKERAATRATASPKPDACETADQRLERMEGQMSTLAGSTQQMAVILTQTDPESGAPLVYGSPQRLVAAINHLGTTIEKLSIKIDHMRG
tara:strand:- start:75 stop:416 length:342 start_codon:yes stop_codon:yes gene_type:complete